MLAGKTILSRHAGTAVPSKLQLYVLHLMSNLQEDTDDLESVVSVL